MSNALLLIVQLVSLLLRNVEKHDDCPDGLCSEPLSEAAAIKAQMKSPWLTFGVWDFLTFVQCVPMSRVMAVGKRIADVIKGCGQCPDGECSIFDILGCLDLKEVVSIAEEVLAIIRDSTICDDGDQKITLGQAAG